MEFVSSILLMMSDLKNNTQDSGPIKGVMGPFKNFPGNWQSSNDLPNMEFVSSIYKVILEIHSSWKTRK